MLPEVAFESVRALECIGTRDPHFPSIVGLRAENDNPPIAGTVGEDVLDSSHDIPPSLRATGVVHFDHNGHTKRVYDIPRSVSVTRVAGDSRHKPTIL